MDRRRFLARAGALGAAVTAWPLVASAAPWRPAVRPPVTRGKVLVVVFLRGGMDGLNLVAPFGDPDYARQRQWLAVAPPGGERGALDLDGFFGLNPAAAPLAPLFADGRAVALHAVGSPANTRSHFEEQDVWETARLGATLRADGWLNRHLATTEGRGPVRAVAVGDSLPRALRGRAQALAFRGLSDFALDGGRSEGPAMAALERAYGAAADADRPRELLSRSGRTALQSLRELAPLADDADDGGVAWPETTLAQRLREVARLVRADVGLEVAAVDFGGWDTHQDQGGYGGPFHRLVAELAGALAAFDLALAERRDDVLVLTLTEFGRTVALNGTGGTDHGWGSCLLALGGPVQRAAGRRDGPVLGAWPGLGREQLRERRDLAHTTDFRDVLAEVTGRHLGSDPGHVVPDHVPTPVDLIA